MRFGTLLAERRTNAWQCTYKMGDEPGLFAVLNAPSIEVANETVAAGAENLELFDLEIVPVNQFPQFA